MVSIDLKDTYLTAPAHLRFNWRGQIYGFQCLPFGLGSAPRKIYKTGHGAERNTIDCFHRRHPLYGTGIAGSDPGSNPIPTTSRIQDKVGKVGAGSEITYLGFLINSKLMMIYFPKEKRQAIIEDCRTALSQELVSVRTLARIIGSCNSGNRHSSTALQEVAICEQQSIQAHSVI